MHGALGFEEVSGLLDFRGLATRSFVGVGSIGVLSFGARICTCGILLQPRTVYFSLTIRGIQEVIYIYTYIHVFYLCIYIYM